MEKELKTKSSIKKIFTLFDKKDWIYLFLSMFLVLCSAISDLLNPFFFSKILNDITHNEIGLSFEHINWVYIILLFVLAIISFICHSFSVGFSTKVAIKMGANIRIITFAKTQEISAADLDEIGSSTIITRISNDAGMIVEFLKMYNTVAFKAVFFLLGGFLLSIIQLVLFDGDKIVWLLCLSYIFVFVFIGLMIYMTKKSSPLFKKAKTIVDSNNTIMEENIIGNKVIRIFNLQKNQYDKYKTGNNNLLEYSIKSDRLVAILMPVANFMINLSTLAIIIFGGIYAWNSDPIQFNTTINLIGVIMSFIQYLTFMMLGMTLLGQFGYTYVRTSVCAQRLFQILELKNSIINCSSPQKIEEPSIEFKNAYFAYTKEAAEAKKYILSNINLSIPSGSSLGIIGQSGSGKTSLVNLISRLYDVNSGEVLISNINVKNIDLENLKKEVGVSLQDKVLLHGSIKSNILLGKPNATDEEVITASKQAQAWEFITHKSGGLSARVEQRGSNLSGG
ncbi:MAG: ABC transporter ATP-binding protein, partial [Mycoplasma sp.]